MSGSSQYKAQEAYQEALLEDSPYVLWLINDNHNTFDFVIDTLMELCKHTYEQALQCAFITHTVGKCDVFTAPYEEVRRIAQLMLNRGLTVKINKADN